MDNEIKGEGNSLNYTFRMHDPRIGRFFAVDPLFKEYPELTPYQFASNSPIDMIEIEGLEGGWIVEKGKATYKSGPVLKTFDSELTAKFAASKGLKTPTELNTWLNFFGRKPSVQKPVAQLRCACAQCTMDKEPYLYLGGRNSIGSPIFREATIGFLTGGIGSVLFKALPKVQIITKAGEAYSKLSVTEKVTYKIGFNVASQTYAKKGKIKDVNVVEAIGSGFKGSIPIIAGETVTYSLDDALEGRKPSVAPLLKTLSQIGGGLGSDAYGNQVNKYLKGDKKNAEVVGEAAKFFVETVSNIAPDAIFPDPDENKIKD